MKLATIGFTKTTAKSFFERLTGAGVKRVLDVRLNNVSQLAGFAKKADLQYFLKAIGGIDYAHVPELAPTQDLLDAYKKNGGPWQVYEHAFLDLMKQRAIDHTLPRSLFEGACLLCSEDKPHHCHRRLVAEYLESRWGDLEIVHL
jgi:uncharacterized protein (DUF488 family)